MGQNPQGVGEYDHFLTGLFNLWITSVPPTDSSAREKIWSRFSQFVSSKDYVAFWSSLYNKSGIQGTPILAFFITYTYFTRQWTTMYPIEANSTCSVASYNEASHLSPDEENALWYVAGYVIRKVMKISLRSGASQEVIQIATLLSFIEDGEELDDDDISDDQGDETLSTAWFDAINRGGLFKCTNDFYKFMSVGVASQVPLTRSGKRATLPYWSCRPSLRHDLKRAQSIRCMDNTVRRSYRYAHHSTKSNRLHIFQSSDVRIHK